MTIARVLPRTTAALDPGAIVASTAEATLRSLWAAPETKTAARGLVVAACAVAAAFPRPFATAAAVLAATAVVLHASNALARPSSLRRGALLWRNHFHILSLPPFLAVKKMHDGVRRMILIK